MNWNYYALLLSILKCYTPEQAFEALERGKPLQWVDECQAEDMAELKAQGYTYKEIGAMYQVSADVVFKRIKRIQQRKSRNLQTAVCI